MGLLRAHIARKETSERVGRAKANDLMYAARQATLQTSSKRNTFGISMRTLHITEKVDSSAVASTEYSIEGATVCKEAFACFLGVSVSSVKKARRHSIAAREAGHRTMRDYFKVAFVTWLRVSSLIYPQRLASIEELSKSFDTKPRPPRKRDHFVSWLRRYAIDSRAELLPHESVECELKSHKNTAPEQVAILSYHEYRLTLCSS